MQPRISRAVLAAFGASILLSGCGERSATETRDELGAQTTPGADGLGAGNPATAGTGGAAASTSNEGDGAASGAGAAAGPTAGGAGNGGSNASPSR
jgi:hypothetical protein